MSFLCLLVHSFGTQTSAVYIANYCLVVCLLTFIDNNSDSKWAREGGRKGWGLGGWEGGGGQGDTDCDILR